MESQALETEKRGHLRRVELIADNWVMNSFEMDADLVRPPSLRLRLEKCVFVGCFEDFKICERFPLFSPLQLAGCPAAKIERAAPDGKADGAELIFYPAINEKVIRLLNLAILELILQDLITRLSLGKK